MACCALAAFAIGCGGGDSSGDRPATISSAATTTASTPARTEELSPDDPRTFAPNPYPEPGTTAPHTEPLRRLIVRDIKRGRGPALRGDEAVYVDIVKTFWRSGDKFLDEWGPGKTGYLLVGTQAPGMRRGMIGMRPGGRRTIAMPGSISDVHSPQGNSYVAAQVDLVLRKIMPN